VFPAQPASDDVARFACEGDRQTLRGDLMSIASHIWKASTESERPTTSGSSVTTRRGADLYEAEIMRFVLLVVTALLALDVSSARADPIPTFRVTDATMLMRPNIGGIGDALTFEFTGPGTDIKGFGGMAGCFEWCDGDPIPQGVGITLNQIAVSNFTKAVLGGQTYDPNFFSQTDPPFFNDAGGLNPIAMGLVGSGSTFFEFKMIMPTNGAWRLSFAQATDENGNPTSRFVGGTFAASATAMSETPDPGTLGLMLIGSAGIWLTRRRKDSCDA
jgi:hypothetical protein